MATTLMTGCGKKAAVDSVKFGEYKGVSYTSIPAEVTDEQVKVEIQGSLDEHTAETEVGRTAKEGDIVSTDSVDMKNGAAFKDGTSSDYDLKLGSGSFIDGFEDGPIDVVKEQELGLNLTFPDPHPNNEKLAGQDVVFDVTVNAVKGSRPAELNDASIRENTEPATVDEYRKVTRENLLAAAQANTDDQEKSEVLQKVMDSSEVTVADATVDAYYNGQPSNYESQTFQAGIDLETMVSYHGSDLNMSKSQLRAMSKEASKQSLVVRTTADTEGIAVAEEDKDALATGFGYVNKDNMVEMVGDTIVNNYILTEKMVSLIADNAVEA